MSKILPCAIAAFCFFNQFSLAQSFNEILGRPTDKSVTVSVLFNQIVEAHVEFGDAPGNLSQSTPAVVSQAATPVTADLQGLQPDARYYYRTVYRTPGSGVFHYGPLRSFHTQRAPGSAFSFIIEADEHLYDKKGIPALYEICLANQALDSADFMISLGDTFGDDHTPLETTSEDMRLLHLDYRQYLGKLCHSTPFLFCLGNHEGESGYWLDQTPPENIAVYGTQWRKFYYPNPYPDGFYSGNTNEEPYGIGLPENYYAFTWGDALFVILDVYRDCDVNEKPKNWEWTLGKTQYDWLKTTLETSHAAHKFVFAHHNRGQGRGGVEAALGCEWGGYGNNGNGAWEFDQMRPGWDKPIHQLMAANGVEIFFQGHDHLYARGVLDGLVYQTVPMPSDTSYMIGMVDNGDAYNDLKLDGSGHLRVSVEPGCATVEYVAAYLPKDTLGVHKNREIRHSYKVGDCAVSAENQAVVRENDFSVYPNPARERLVVQALDPAGFERRIDVFTMQGQWVKSAILPAGAKNCDLDLADVPAGCFALRISGERSAFAGKFVVLHQD